MVTSIGRSTAALALVGCTTFRVDVVAQMYDVKPHEAELAAGSPIRVSTPNGPRTLDPTREVDIVDKLSGRTTRVRLVDVYAKGCPATTAYDQLCTIEHVNEIVIGEEEQRDYWPALEVGGGIAVAGGLTGLAACAIDCGGTARTASIGTLVGLGVVTIAFLIYAHVAAQAAVAKLM